MKATWKGKVIAESNHTINIEGNQYFPPNSVKKDFLEVSSHQTMCPWKGMASYFNIKVEGEINENAAWYYPETKPAADGIKDYIAFWKGVEVS